MYISINPSANQYLRTLRETDPQKRKKAISISCANGWEMHEYEWGQDIFHNILCPTIFESGHKVNADAILTNGFMVDIDDPQIVNDEFVIEELLKQELAFAFIYTANHMRDKDGVTCPRYRVYLPFDAPYEIDKKHKEKIKLWMSSNPAFNQLKIDHDCAGVHRYFFVGSDHCIQLGKFVSYTDICALKLPVVKRAATTTICSRGEIPKEIQDLISSLQPNNRSSLTCTIAGKLQHYSQAVKDKALEECIQRGIDDSAIKSFKKYSVGEDRSIDTSSLEGILKLQAIARKEAKSNKEPNK